MGHGDSDIVHDSSWNVARRSSLTTMSFSFFSSAVTLMSQPDSETPGPFPSPEVP